MKKVLQLMLICSFTILMFEACKVEEKEEIEKEKEEEIIPIDSSLIVDIVELSTPYGEMYIWLYDTTPLHKANFLKLVNEEFYNGLIFHRVIPNFMIQGGDPAGNGSGGPGYTIPAEIIPGINHKKGSLAAARLGDDVNPQRASSGSQFYIAVSTQGTAHLNGQYTVFGEVFKGIEAADSIVIQPRNTMNNKPHKDISMSMKVVKISLNKLKEEYDFEP